MNFLATLTGVWADVEAAAVILFAITVVVVLVWSAITKDWKDKL